MLKIDWKRKFTSRKFWAAIAGMVTAILAFCGANGETTTQVTAIISAAGVLIAYILGEGFTDAAHINDEGNNDD